MTEPIAYWTDPAPEPPASLLFNHEGNAFVFLIEGKEVLRIEKEGKVLVHGRECGNDAEVFETLRRFFSLDPSPSC